MQKRNIKFTFKRILLMFMYFIQLHQIRKQSTTRYQYVSLLTIGNSIYLSIDEIRRTFPPNPNKDIREKNKEAFEIILTKTKEGLLNKKNVIIDCGVSEERAKRFEKISKDMEISLYKFFLKAKYETQLSRVEERDKARGRESTNVERFDEIYHYFNKKGLTDYIVLDTDKLDTHQIAEVILKTVTS